MHISREKTRPNVIINPHDEILQEILGAVEGGVNSHSLAEVRIPPGKSSVAHYHKESEETYLILSGQASMRVDDHHFQLNTGDACYIQPEEIHLIFNESDSDLVFLAICVPAWRPGDSFEVSGDSI